MAARITGVATSEGVLHGRRLCGGAGQLFAAAAAPLGIAIPVYPIKGYSITVPITDAGGAPESTVMDETYKVAITRLGDRIRVGGTAEISGYDLRLHAARRATLEHSVGDLFPRGGDLPGKFLVRAEADDAGRPADHRRHQAFQSLSQHRPRHAGLDHGVWFGPGAGRQLRDASRTSIRASFR